MRNVIFGLTGNMGCGKSTVAGMLACQKNVSVIDCDTLAKEIIFDDQNHQTVCRILNLPDDTVLDRQGIAAIIFTDRKKRKALEAFVTPLVWQRILDTVGAMPEETVIVVESATLYETGWGSGQRFDAIVTATCSVPEQLRRLREDRGMSESEIAARRHQQFSSRLKERRADCVINTECSMEELGLRVADLYAELLRRKAAAV
jgi:dephospho-CoA kinase